MKRISESYYLKDEIPGYSVESRNKLASAFENIGFKYYAPQMGGGGEALKAIEQVIASLNLHNFWFDIFVGVAANRLDKALSTVYNWFRKNKSKNKEKPVVEVFIYTPLRGKNNCYYIRFKADKKYSKKEILKLLKQMKKEQS